MNRKTKNRISRLVYACRCASRCLQRCIVIFGVSRIYSLLREASFLQEKKSGMKQITDGSNHDAF